ncbi:MAG: hypothetical protein ABI679_09040 [Gemmatimonadota bacterium]
MNRGRPLTPAEVVMLGSFASQVDLSRVRIYSRQTIFGRVLSVLSRGSAIALGFRIVVPGEVLPALLAHEMVHVHQYERWGAVRYLANGFWHQFILRGLLGRDVYAWEFVSGKSFDQFGMEQQGQIVQDCFDPASPKRRVADRVSPFAPPGAR